MSVHRPDSTTAPAIAGVTPQPRQLAAGAALFRQGDASVGIYRVAAGAMRLRRTTVDGSAVTIHVAQSGELFAEASLFAERYHCDAIAERDSAIWHYPAAALRAGLLADPQALWAFSADLARALQALRLRYELKQTRSAPLRLQQFLSLRADADGSVGLIGSLKDLAGELGLTHEALYRALATLERQGLVRRSDGRLCLQGRRAR